MEQLTKEVILASSLTVLIVLIGISLYFRSEILNNNENFLVDQGNYTYVIRNPIIGQTTDQALMQINHSHVEFMLYRLKINELHNPPFSEDRPAVFVQVDNQTFYALVEDGKISLYPTLHSKPDIELFVPRAEILGMLNSTDYYRTSFRLNQSRFVQVRGIPTLAAKGYSDIFYSMTGNSLIK